MIAVTFAAVAASILPRIFALDCASMLSKISATSCRLSVMVSKIAYATASRQLAEEQEKLREILMRRAGYERKSKELVNGTLDIQEIRECKRAIDVMKSLQRAQMMKVHAAEKTLEMARIELNRVMVERKTHEKLRERAFEEFKQEIAQAESKEIDELVSYNYHEG